MIAGWAHLLSQANSCITVTDGKHMACIHARSPFVRLKRWLERIRIIRLRNWLLLTLALSLAIGSSGRLAAWLLLDTHLVTHTGAQS